LKAGSQKMRIFIEHGPFNIRDIELQLEDESANPDLVEAGPVEVADENVVVESFEEENRDRRSSRFGRLHSQKYAVRSRRCW